MNLMVRKIVELNGCAARLAFAFVILTGIGANVGAYAQRVQFTRVSGSEEIPSSESRRIERFLTHVFPLRQMKHLEHTSDKPVIERAVYSVVTQQAKRFVLAGFTARWGEAVNVFGIYRIDSGSPNQVWRSKPWEASYYGLQITPIKTANHSLVLFQEGGIDAQYSLASVFTFDNHERGVAVHDLTPSLPLLRARTHFPFRPLYGQRISLSEEAGAKNSLLLSASDALYSTEGAGSYRPETLWRYNARRDRFERVKQTNGNPSLTLH